MWVSGSGELSWSGMDQFSWPPEPWCVFPALSKCRQPSIVTIFNHFSHRLPRLLIAAHIQSCHLSDTVAIFFLFFLVMDHLLIETILKERDQDSNWCKGVGLYITATLPNRFGSTRSRLDLTFDSMMNCFFYILIYISQPN